jgi:putative transposase
MDAERVFFITTVTAQRQAIFRQDGAASLLIDTFVHYWGQKKYLLHEFVVMPDHVHALITPASQISLERAVQFIKGGFSFRFKSRFPVWQAGFSNHRVRDFVEYQNHREYIWLNPVRAGLAERAEAYRYSSACNAWPLDPIPQRLKPIMTERLTRA